MSLWAGTNTKYNDRKRILEFLNDPTLPLWEEIADIRVTKAHTLWNSVALIKPKYLFEYDNAKMHWKTFPDAIMLSRAIHAAVKYEKELREDILVWPRPAA